MKRPAKTIPAPRRPSRLATSAPKDRRPGWRAALITDTRHTHNVSLRALTADGSTETGKTGSSASKLWEVGVDIEHQAPAASVYLPQSARPRYADPGDHAFVTITIGCPRGEITNRGEIGKVDPVTTTIRCQLGHIDALVLALSNVLIMGRRDGSFPVARGMKSFSASTIAATQSA